MNRVITGLLGYMVLYLAAGGLFTAATAGLRASAGLPSYHEVTVAAVALSAQMVVEPLYDLLRQPRLWEPRSRLLAGVVVARAATTVGVTTAGAITGDRLWHAGAVVGVCAWLALELLAAIVVVRLWHLWGPLWPNHPLLRDVKRLPREAAALTQLQATLGSVYCPHVVARALWQSGWAPTSPTSVGPDGSRSPSPPRPAPTR